jgi:tetratricopeptide (TPR) repeat protein
MGDHVFICYSRKDEEFVIKLATNLKRQGVPVWLDQWDIPHGANWPREIDRSLSDCARLLLVLSPASVDSDEVQSEWYTVLDEKKVVVPILYQKCHIPFRLKPIQYIEFTSRSPDDPSALNDVLIALGKEESTFSRPAEISVPKKKPKKKLSVPSSSEYDEAIKAYNKAIEIDPEDADSWSSKAWALRHLGKYNEAIKAYNKAIEIEPENAGGWYCKAEVLLHLGKYNEAIIAFDKSIEIFPDGEFWNAKAVALQYLGKYDEAIIAFDKSIEIDPEDADSWSGKAAALQYLGKYDEAIKAYEKAGELRNS